MEKIILASASPRRAQLLEQVGVRFAVMVSEADESIEEKVLPEVYVGTLALRKAQAVAAKCEEGLVIGADTVVVCDGEILGKPKDRADAKKMLESLSGRMHKVMSGVAIVNSADDTRWQWVEETRVYFRAITEEELEQYLDTQEYRDKAGAYGIQGYGALLAERIEGDYYNVVGLPLGALAVGLKQMGVSIYGYGR